MDRSEIAHPIPIVLDGSNYVIWAQAMSGFIKGKRLWRIINGTLNKPVQNANETENAFADRLDEWDGKTYQIITWFRNTCVPSISLQFGRFQDDDTIASPAKAIWDFLKERYQTTGHAHQYQLLQNLHHMRQASGQSINDFLSKMYSIWDQLAQSEPRWKHSDDAKLFITYRDHQRLLQFLMALDNTFEPVRASLLHRLPLPTLEQAVSELISEETRFGTLKIQNMESVMASTFKPQNMNSVMATPQSRSFSQRTCPYCSNRRLSANHSLEKCQVRKCLSCHKIAPGHLQSNCPQITGTESSRSRYKFKPFPASRSAATAASEGFSSSSHIESSTPSFSMDDVASIIKHMMSTGTTSSPSIALSATSGSSDKTDPWDRP